MDDSSSRVRISPLSPRCVPPSARLVARLAGLAAHTEPPGLFATIGRHRRLSRWWLPFAGMLLLRGELPRRDAELVVLRTAWNCRCAYIWIHHVARASRAGIGPEAIIASASELPASSAPITERQSLLFAAGDQLHQDRLISDATWSRLTPELDERQLIELCFLVGHYEMLAMTLNSLGVEPETRAGGKLRGPAAAIAAQLRAELSAAGSAGSAGAKLR